MNEYISAKRACEAAIVAALKLDPTKELTGWILRKDDTYPSVWSFTSDVVAPAGWHTWATYHTKPTGEWSDADKANHHALCEKGVAQCAYFWQEQDKTIRIYSQEYNGEVMPKNWDIAIMEGKFQNMDEANTAATNK